MANQQLINYLKEQIEAGAKEEDLKKVLLNVGWREEDIAAALEEIKGSKEIKKTQEESAPQILKETTKEPLVDLKPTETEPAKQPSQFISPQSFISDLNKIDLSKKEEKKIETEEKLDKNVVNLKTPNVVPQVAPQQINIISSPQPRKFKIMIYSVFGILIAGLLGLIVFLYLQKNNLEKKLIITTSRQGDLDNQVQSLNKTIAQLQNEISTLKEKNEELNIQNDNLANQLLLFSVATSSLEVKLSGKLSFERSTYFIKTPQGIVVNIKNSKDEKVKKILDSFLNQEVKVGGIRTPGVREITVIEINEKTIDQLISSLESQEDVLKPSPTSSPAE